MSDEANSIESRNYVLIRGQLMKDYHINTLEKKGRRQRTEGRRF